MRSETRALPTFLRIKLAKLRGELGGEREERSYAELGWCLGKHHIESFNCGVYAVCDVDEGEAAAHPTKVLRSLFRDYDLGDALVGAVPVRHRRDFLAGIMFGAADESVPLRS